MIVKINKEIRGYEETLFFGLSLRQFVCSVLAVGVAVALFFGLQNVLDRETLSWVCILAAVPIAVAGFFRYNGMTFERFLCAFIKSALLCSGHRVWRAENHLLNAILKESKEASRT